MVLNNKASLHWRTLELLSRYAEALSADFEVERMYPLVSLHLIECEDCRETLGQLLALPDSSPDNIVTTLDSKVRIETRLNSEVGGMRWAMRPDSHSSAFGLQIAIRIGNAKTKTDSTMSHPPKMQRVDDELFIEWQLRLPLKSSTLSLQAIIQESANRLSLTGHLSGLNLPQLLKTHLFIGHDVHHIDVQFHKFQFVNVGLESGASRIALLLESSSQNI